MKIDRIYRKLFLTMLVGMFSFFMVGCSEEEPEECYVDASAYLPNEEEITQTTVTLHGEISISAGVVTEYGFYLSDKRAELETAAPSAKKVATGGSYANFSRRCTGLKSGTPYYFRAFASNGKSSVFGKTMEFSTKQPASPTLDELIYSAVTDNSIDLSCTILDAGVEIINTITYGFEYKKSGDANWTPKTDGVQQNEDGSFSATLTGLSSETDYKIRAFAKNEIGNGYSKEKSITTGKKLTPVVSMDNINNYDIDNYKGGIVTATGLKVSGYIDEVYSTDGVVSEVGFLYSTSHNLTYASAEHFKVEPNDGNYGKGGTFTAELVNLLRPNTQYYICPYAKDEDSDGNPVYGYGDVKSFTTRAFEKPRLDGMNADAIKMNSISVSVSNMTYNGTLAEYGFIWGKASEFSGTDLTLGNCGENKITFTPVGEEAVSSFSTEIGRLETNTKYQIKAYAISSYVVDGETHKSEVGYASIERITADWSAPSLGDVVLNYSSHISLSVSASLNSYHETATLTECGFIWIDDIYNSRDLTLGNCGNNKIIATLDENNAFECIISDLDHGTNYQVAAYATVTYPNGEIRTGYSRSYFSTESSTLTLNYLELEKANYTSLSVYSSLYSYNETPEQIECGFIWMDNDTYKANEYNNLTLENCGENKLTATLDANNKFKGTITGLSPGTEYEMKAYVTIIYPGGEKQTRYSSYSGSIWTNSLIKTSSVPISVSSSNIGIDSFTVSGGAGYISETEEWNELGENLEAGFCWTFEENINPADIPEENRMSAELKETEYSQTERYRKKFTSDISVPEGAGMTCYVWAYLKYKDGIVYSGRISVKLKSIPGKDDHGDPTIKK